MHWFVTERERDETKGDREGDRREREIRKYEGEGERARIERERGLSVFLAE